MTDNCYRVTFDQNLSNLHEESLVLEHKWMNVSAPTAGQAMKRCAEVLVELGHADNVDHALGMICDITRAESASEVTPR